MEELLQHCSHVSGYENEVVENDVALFLFYNYLTMINGHSVNLGKSLALLV